MFVPRVLCLFFFFNDTATTEIYTLSLHDALPISGAALLRSAHPAGGPAAAELRDLRPEAPPDARVAREHPRAPQRGDRKSTRLNSSHSQISYAVFCLKKKKNKRTAGTPNTLVTHN